LKHTARELLYIIDGGSMSIIDKMIRNRKNIFTNGRYVFDDDDPQTKYLLSTINSNQKNRWKKRHTIPHQVLAVFWNWGICVNEKSPEKGMALSKFLELLLEFSRKCSDSETRAAAIFLYDDTVKSELMPTPKIRIKKSGISSHRKHTPIFHIRETHGTILIDLRR